MKANKLLLTIMFGLFFTALPMSCYGIYFVFTTIGVPGFLVIGLGLIFLVVLLLLVYLRWFTE